MKIYSAGIKKLIFKMETRPLRAVKDVKRDFQNLNIKIGWKISNLLTFLSRKPYEAFCVRLKSFKELRDFEKLLVDNIKIFEGSEFISNPEKFLPDEFLDDQIKGAALDLENLDIKLAQFNKHREHFRLSSPAEMDIAKASRALEELSGEYMVTINGKSQRKERLASSSLGMPAREYKPERLWHALQARFSMTDFKKFRDRLSGKAVRLEVMDLREPHKNVDEDLILDLIACKREISQKAWEKNTGIEISGYTDEYIVKHFMQVDREFLVYDPKVCDIVAFCGMNRLKGKDDLTVHVLEVSMVKPNYQNMRISSTLVSRLIIDAFIANRLNPITVAGRTANPQVLGAMLALSDCFPNPLEPGTLSTEKQRKVFDLVANFLNPKEAKDEKTFVIHDVYPLATGLIVPPENIPEYSRDLRVKALCEKLLEYEKYNRPDFYSGELDQIDMLPIVSSLNAIAGSELIRTKPAPKALEEEFNTAVLGFTGFYDKVKHKLNNLELDPAILNLIKITQEDREVDFNNLNPKKQFVIMSLNRMLLEILFPFLPKRAAKAMIVQGEINTKAKRAFEKKQRKRKMQNFVLSKLQWAVNR